MQQMSEISIAAAESGRGRGATDEPVLVAVAAHADDVELNAGGTIAKWARTIGPVHVVMASNNMAGRPWEAIAERPQPGESYAEAARRIRHAEQDAAAAHVGATVHYLDHPQRFYSTEDEPIFLGFQPSTSPPGLVRGRVPLVLAAQHDESVESLARLLADLRPTLVLTQSPLDRDPEHHALASMVWRVFNDHRDELSRATLRVWEAGSSCEIGMVPQPFDAYEDISDFYDVKLGLCGFHRSQMIPSRWERVAARAGQWGRHLGVRYAEAFCTAHFPDP